MHEFHIADPKVVARWTPEFLYFMAKGLEKYNKELERARKKASRKAKRKH